MSLFQKSVLNKYLQSLDNAEVEKVFQKFKSFYGDEERIDNIKLLKEENYQEGFLREIFVDVLGYTINPDKDYNLTTEFKNETDSKKADGAILLDGKAIGVIELKSTKTTDMESIIDQAFNYKNHQTGCKYVITSNFEKLRFYIDNATEYEEFYLFDMDLERFKIFYLLLSKEKLLNDIPAKIKKESQLHEEDISDKLYKDYTEFKYKIYRNLIKNNPQYDKLVLFKKSQKLLDRILFILFAEDSGLVPPNAISEIIKQWKTLIDLDEKKSLYSRFVKFFHHLNVGHKYSKFEVPAYNGGLFKEDEILDNVKIDDEILLDDALKLSTYDYSTEVDVNILGHIFEHSISEIEEITAELEGEERDASKSKRKKEGVFYTPKYITKYIVEKTIGELCEAKKKELHLDEIDEEILENSKTAKGKLTKKAETLFNNLKTYREYILSLKILDPACGSGAFLNQALDFLIEEHKWIDEQRSRLLKESFTIVEYEKDILEHNLYGVDINEEAVEIAKLSLWLRTAKKGRKLSDLSGNIKCGNSLIDDPEVAGDKAFKWEEEFPEIMSGGGFDVVIGNPPYVMLSPDKLNKYEFVQGNYNTYVAFVELSISLIKTEGYLGLIIPNTWFSGDNFLSFRTNLLTNHHIVNIIQLPYDVFAAYVDTSILILKKSGKLRESKTYQYDIRAPKEEINIYRFQSINQNEWIRYRKIFLNEKLIEIGDKVWFSSANILLGDIAEINRGTLPPKDREKSTKKDDYYNIEWFEDQVFRYQVASRSSTKIFVNYESLRENKKIEVFLKPKILARQLMSRQFRINATLVDGGFAFKKNLYAIYNLSEDFNYHYVLAIINSKLFSFCQVQFNASLQRDDFPAFSLNDFREFPIRKLLLAEQEKYQSIVDMMLKLNRNKDNVINNFLNRIQSTIGLTKPSTKLSEFYNHDFKTFLDELKKKKVTLSLKQQDEWEEYFNEHKEKILELQSQINQTGREIDQLVYQLYGLTEEEIKIVEESVSN